MHYAEFDGDESQALLQAIKEYEAQKWKVIGQKLGKPAKVRRLLMFCSIGLRFNPYLPFNSNLKKLTCLFVNQACEQYAKQHFSGK
jgi:hypothetical protein